MLELEKEQTLSPEQLAESGKLSYEREDYLEAARAFEAAAAAYRARGEVLDAAEMDNNRSVALLQAGEAQLALQAVEGTVESFSQANDKRRAALALGNKAAALDALGQLEQAEAFYRQSAQWLAEVGEMELRASVMQSLSRLQARSGRFLDAVTSMYTGLNEVDKPTLKQKMLKKLLELPFQILNRG